MPWAKMIRRKFCRDNSIAFEEVIYANDEVFSTKVGVKTDKYLYINLLVYYYERRNGSLINKLSLENYLCRLYVCFRKNKILKQYGKSYDFNYLYIHIYYKSYWSFLLAFFRELKILGWKRTRRDYIVMCHRLDISLIPFFKAISIRRLKHHFFSVKNNI